MSSYFTDARTEEIEHRERLEAAVALRPAYPAERFAGRGVVICGGGAKYFPCVYVCVRVLRAVGCKLPIEVWHLGAAEMSPEMRAILEPLGVRVVDAHVVREQHPVRYLQGWELKAYALLHCAFEEVLLLDADNVAVRDPSFLFDEPEYQKIGAIFWPDYGRLEPERCIWRIMGIPYRDEPEFESGQIVVDKRQCWPALQLAMHLNEWSEFYYRHIHGDKETFHMAWRKLGQDYIMPSRGIYSLPSTMCQHDLQGRRLFQHRNFDKWRVWGGNERIGGFEHETLCLGFLAELRLLWRQIPPGIRHYVAERKSPTERAAAERLIATRWDYHRIGHDRRPLTFLPDGAIGEGAAECELFWDLHGIGGLLFLEVYAADFRTFTAQQAPDGQWCGQWEHFELMPVEITPLSEEENRAHPSQQTTSCHPSASSPCC